MMMKATKISAMRPPMCRGGEPLLASDLARGYPSGLLMFAVRIGLQEIMTSPGRPG
jgi:hypothetical protein